MEQFAEAARVAAKRAEDAKVIEHRLAKQYLTLTLPLPLTLTPYPSTGSPSNTPYPNPTPNP